MNSKLISTADKTYALVFQQGDEVMDGLRSFAVDYAISAAQFSAIGAFSQVELAYFDWETRQYQSHTFSEQMEVLSLLGTVSVKDDQPTVHAHIVLGLRDFTVRGGHLMKGVVRPTLEIVLSEAPRSLRRKYDPQSGLSLIDPSS
jgi:predicted DNA-binding protein with PD1-like motif